ncbi:MULTISPECIES: 50S ribosomal protein L31 [Chromohalobacter]|uniref:Large ribosomal subunit protein bL31 n=1 Tax=Chromohalobacter israelensis (strain ATCC BAA-138 / DSM 3043 / CIP 106854 / NCIMB 13768 / 1H11) TaxID=290398 RepID=RL31_CHRI1|nr:MULTISPECIES: 50S ribosomal protein L31 [Chromohalobacter]Q1QZZ2.1 RecName: Full=Large ribosomal subunit protein bL31; AltName: Full=50S ribosomal protein L31 [Chromohalobacter salexigens DSM 3043]ABE57966.1 LSU ribosomal protein L31P [Chromohalobacter salexigens DSM 3043]MBZ5876103.1 50S ribosomal protein L31 [Chromohalobacter salexigens]MDF9433839.1 50S ribosomal protein L31 [Chromohalobacter israelensis]MDO0946969.1 50S ribosomal protein L31 [Chromohalobacter salexigens]NQY46884.1 50S r
MKQAIHPEYKKVTATCSCGATFEFGSTAREDFYVDVCSQCHPFYTGKQKQATTGGRVERFNKRFGAAIKRN